MKLKIKTMAVTVATAAAAAGIVVGTTGAAHAANWSADSCRDWSGSDQFGYHLRPCIGRPLSAGDHTIDGRVTILAPDNAFGGHGLSVCADIIKVRTWTLYASNCAPVRSLAGSVDVSAHYNLGGWSEQFIVRGYYIRNGYRYDDVESPRDYFNLPRLTFRAAHPDSSVTTGKDVR